MMADKQEMMPLFGQLFQYLVARIITALGLTFVTYAGYMKGMNELKEAVKDTVQNMPDDILNILLLAGFGEGIGYLFGAMTFVVTMTTINRLTFIAPKS